ncbi:13692_t:CDS:2 [Gigaspora margarita]|uniref:13692_t:CDS:1 n=1 Tax=Gigaspora margarita TaxID=4874 RepID=A0ABN7V341_GIGMA|nr:13692_t:CDS:2 [Gigaspora margarita]
MIQLLANELQIQILTNVIAKTNFEYFCTLRTVCKQWNTFIPLVMSEIIISRLNSGLIVELTDWFETKSSKEIPPTYDDQTKTFTFLFNKNVDSYNSIYYRKFSKYESKNFIAFVEKTENFFIPIKLGAIFGSLTYPEFVNNDTYKHEFDSKNKVLFRRVIDDKNISHVEFYSFTIAAWKLYYILDCLQITL